MQSLVVLIQLVGTVLAVNDWSTACHEGQCAWDVPSSAEYDGSASLQLWSTSPAAIADITPAAGWAVLACSGSITTQTVRIACVDPSSGCSHLLDANTNPTGRIVRLTDECGIMPFARIAYMRLSADQTLPSVLSHRAVPLSVYDVALDTDFGADDSEHGPVSFAMTAASRPDIRASTIERVPQGRYQSRAFVDEQEQLAKRAYVENGLRELTTRYDRRSFDENKNASVLLYVNRTENIFNTTIDCTTASVPFDASVVADVDAVADAEITFGIVVAGTLTPVPNLDKAAITAEITGSIDGAIRVQADAEGTFSHSITLFEFPLPGGIIVPGFLEFGPAFKVRASVDANLENAIDTTIGLSYRVENATLVYPSPDDSDQGEKNGTFTANETPLQIGMDTDATGSLSLTGHLIPELVIGIDAFPDHKSVHVAVEFALSLDASATVTVNSTAGITDSSNSSAVVAPQGACVDVSTALVVGANVNTTLFKVFRSGEGVNLYNQTFDLYSTCTDLADTNSTSSGNSTTAGPLAGTSSATFSSSASTASSNTMQQWSARAAPISADAIRVAHAAARSSSTSKQQPTLACPGHPFSVKSPIAAAKVTPTALHGQRSP